MHTFSLIFIIGLTTLAQCASLQAKKPQGPRALLDGTGAQHRPNETVAGSPHQVRLQSRISLWISSRVATPAQQERRTHASAGLKRSPGLTPVKRADARATPAPTGDSSPSTTVHITDEKNFSLLAPSRTGEQVSEAENDGVSFCTPGAAAAGDVSCSNTFSPGFITAAAFERAGDDSWIQITGCLDPSKSILSPTDEGGQFDVRFPNGAQCTFGGYGASFIELMEPSANRFCLRCCSSPNDQVNCNSHQDRAGCPVAIPGTYDFPALGVDCS